MTLNFILILFDSSDMVKIKMGLLITKGHL